MKPHNTSANGPPDGALFAYINNDLETDQALADAVQELLGSEEGQNELLRLAEMDQWLLQQVGGLNVPDPQDLVDVATGQANDQQRLIVAAYVRNSVRGRNEMQMLEEEMASEQAPQVQSLFQLPQFIAIPLQAVSGLRSGSADSRQQAFMVADIQAQVTLRISPPLDTIWRLEGYVTQEYLPAANAQVILAQGERETLVAESDESGFFAFQGLTQGHYSMQIQVEKGLIVIQDINLSETDV